MTGLTSLVLASFLAVGPGETAPEPAANLKPTPAIAAEYESLKAQTGRDAESQVKLALWCEKHGLETERFKHLAAVVLRDPSNALARGLMGLVEYQGKWKRPEAVADAMKLDVAHADLLAEYNGRRVKAAVAVAPQLKLATWCEEKGLKDEARAHLATVVRLDPSNADAWKKLGYKKVGNRWVTEGQAAMDKAERDTQATADRKWKPRLEALRDQLKGKPKREEAEKALAEISDPRAVPMVMKTFIGKDIAQQRMAVQLLGQIDAIEASRSLAKIALLVESAEIRAKAIDTLKRRDAREWADMPIGLLRSKIVYTMKPVGGPKDPGVLDIKLPTLNYKRIYRQGEPFVLLPGDVISYDASGQPWVTRVGAVIYSGRMIPSEFFDGLRANNYTPTGVSPVISPQMAMYYSQAMARLQQPVSPGPNSQAVFGQLNQSLQHTPLAGQGQNLAMGMVETERENELSYLRLQGMQIAQANQAAYMRSVLLRSTLRDAHDGATEFEMNFRRKVSAPLAQLQYDSINSQTFAVDQLKADKASLDQLNIEIAEANSRSLALLTACTSQSFGGDRQAWEKWLSHQIGYAFMTPTDVPTVVETVGYAPATKPYIEVLNIRRYSCFGKGTPRLMPT